MQGNDRVASFVVCARTVIGSLSGWVLLNLPRDSRRGHEEREHHQYDYHNFDGQTLLIELPLDWWTERAGVKPVLKDRSGNRLEIERSA